MQCTAKHYFKDFTFINLVDFGNLFSNYFII